MSLPPTLLQRLASRGLLNKQKASQSEAIEEIIAENYDEDDKSHPYTNIEHDTTTTKHTGSNEQFWPDRIKERIGVTESHHGFKFCPNKSNIYHSCTLYCVNRWPTGHAKANEKYLRRYKRLVRKYPLSADWKEMYDNGYGFYYFYNSASRKVSWLPPTHPKARISNSAAIFRKQLANSNDKYNFDTPFTSNNNDTEDGPQAPSFAPSKKQKVRDLERTILRKQRV
ncbi:uncharacterized protein LOC117790479 [Drosophila innubila]|uniref:uncharacterized protein LOC117790479 n=1 Tax=Drosophila innubila TaxID=198719 RepID=UPI00148E3495|nr:uncharacterized protein LOC117790479 [Drosophila innubila]